MSNLPRAFGLALSALTTLPGFCFAASCSAELHEAQAAVDRLIEVQAGRGVTGPETTFATLGRQPTPASLARAERKLGEGDRFQAILSQLRAARVQLAAGDEAACSREIHAAQKALKRNF